MHSWLQKEQHSYKQHVTSKQLPVLCSTYQDMSFLLFFLILVLLTIYTNSLYRLFVAVLYSCCLHYVLGVSNSSNPIHFIMCPGKVNYLFLMVFYFHFLSNFIVAQMFSSCHSLHPSTEPYF